MKTTTIFTTLAAAIPTLASTFTGLAIHSGSPIHLLSLSANGSGIWINKPSSSYCPSSISSCPPGNSTVFTTGNSTLSLAVEVPGGQQIYVGADGALGYTVPHSGTIPAGASTTGFAVVDEGLHVQFKGNDFYAVPVGGEVYKVYAAAVGASPKNGTGFEFRFQDSSVQYGAWEY